jgi:hypothetical protein
LARGFLSPTTPAVSQVMSTERFAPEKAHVVGGTRSAAKWLHQATFYGNGKGGAPYPSEKQYLAMLCEYEDVPKWWGPDGIGEPTTVLQKQMFKHWGWSKQTISTAFTNARSNLKNETARLFFSIYGLKPVKQVKRDCGDLECVVFWQGMLE